MRFLFFLIIVGINPLWSSGNNETYYPNNDEFRTLSLEEQFNIYIHCDPLTDDFMDSPIDDMYLYSMIYGNDINEVFNLAKRYSDTIILEYFDGGINNQVKDYRFTLLLNLFGTLHMEFKLKEDQKNWLNYYYRNQILHYIKQEKRIDINTVNICWFIDYKLVEEKPEERNIGKFIYDKYIIIEKLLLPEEVYMDEIYSFWGFEGIIIPQ